MEINRKRIGIEKEEKYMKIAVEKIKGFITEKWICASCHRHYITTPVLANDMDGNCTCGCTSFIINRGRNLGRKSKHWGYYLNIYNSIKDTIPKELLKEMAYTI